ncbi:hypothetical protein ACWGCI_28355, partial [Streptomyces sp. NPDC054949]
MSSVVTAVVGVVVLLVLLALVVVTRYKVAGPSEAFIITGRRGKRSTDPETGRISTDNTGHPGHQDLAPGTPPVPPALRPDGTGLVGMPVWMWSRPGPSAHRSGVGRGG